MPPAFVLSQDQTLKFDVPPHSRRNVRPCSSSFLGAVPAHLCETIRRSKNHNEQSPRMETCKGLCETAWLLPSTLHLEAARPGAAAHMSLHQNHNVKERQKPTHRLSPFSGATCAPDFRCPPRRSVKSTASVEWLLCPTPHTVNTVLHFYGVFIPEDR